MHYVDTSLKPAIAGNIKASSEPSHICFFHPPLIFQICLNYFFPKIIRIPLPTINHNKAASAPSLDAFLPIADISNLFELFFSKIIHIPLPTINHNKAASAPSLDAFFAYR